MVLQDLTRKPHVTGWAQGQPRISHHGSVFALCPNFLSRETEYYHQRESEKGNVHGEFYFHDKLYWELFNYTPLCLNVLIDSAFVMHCYARPN